MTDIHTLVVLALVSFFARTACAQEISGFQLTPQQASVGQVVSVDVQFTPVSGGTWCGLRLDFGDGEVREIRVDKNSINATKQYAQPGRYTLRVEGKNVIRGLKSAASCGGSPRIATLNIVDPAQERASAAAAAAEQARAADREREIQTREKELKARELDLRARELDERERKVRASEVAPPVSPIPAPVSAPPVAAAAEVPKAPSESPRVSTPPVRAKPVSSTPKTTSPKPNDEGLKAF